MTLAKPGDAFHLDLGGPAIVGRYIEVDPPHRLVMEWNPQGTDNATSTPVVVEITLTPTGAGTDVTVELSGLSPEDEAANLQLWTQHLDRIAAVIAGAEPGVLPGS